MARGPLFSGGVAEKIVEAINSRRVLKSTLTEAVWDAIQEITDAPSIGIRDEEGVFGGIRVHRFSVERPPLVFRAAIAYSVIRREGVEWVKVLDFAWE